MFEYKVQYTEENIAYLIRRVKSLKKEYGVTPNRVHSDLELMVAKLNRKGSRNQVCWLSKTTFFDRLKYQRNLTKAFSPKAFNLLAQYLEQFPESGSNAIQQEIGLNSAFMSFAEISSTDSEVMKQVLPGLYRTYRPSIGKRGFVVTGLMEIFFSQEDGAVRMAEIMLYKRRKHGKKLCYQRHRFRGMVWYSNGQYVMLSYDSNTRFIQTIMVRSVLFDRVEEQLEGAYLTSTNKGGSNTVCSKIILERLHIGKAPYSGRFKALRDTIGYKHPDHEDSKFRIEVDLWDRIDPEISSNLIRF